MNKHNMYNCCNKGFNLHVIVTDQSELRIPATKMTRSLITDHWSGEKRLDAIINSIVNPKIARLTSFEKLTEPGMHELIKSTLSDRSMSWTTKRSSDIHSFLWISNDVHENRKWCAHSKVLRHNGQIGFFVKLEVNRSPCSLLKPSLI